MVLEITVFLYIWLYYGEIEKLVVAGPALTFADCEETVPAASVAVMLYIPVSVLAVSSVNVIGKAVLKVPNQGPDAAKGMIYGPVVVIVEAISYIRALLAIVCSATKFAAPGDPATVTVPETRLMVEASGVIVPRFVVPPAVTGTSCTISVA